MPKESKTANLHHLYFLKNLTKIADHKAAGKTSFLLHLELSGFLSSRQQSTLTDGYAELSCFTVFTKGGSACLLSRESDGRFLQSCSDGRRVSERRNCDCDVHLVLPEADTAMLKVGSSACQAISGFDRARRRRATDFDHVVNPT